MGFWKLCPVCFKIRIYRREIRTCGSPGCTELWRSYTVDAKARAVEQADAMKDGAYIAPIMPPTGGEPSPIEPKQTSTEIDDEYLEKLFGPGAPGVAKKDK